VVFVRQYPLVGKNAFCPRNHRGFLLASSSLLLALMSTDAGYRVKVKIHDPNCLNDWQLPGASSPGAESNAVWAAEIFAGAKAGSRVQLNAPLLLVPR
jgi:hypothetical protein